MLNKLLYKLAFDIGREEGIIRNISKMEHNVPQTTKSRESKLGGKVIKPKAHAGNSTGNLILLPRADTSRLSPIALLLYPLPFTAQNRQR